MSEVGSTPCRPLLMADPPYPASQDCAGTPRAKLPLASLTSCTSLLGKTQVSPPAVKLQ